MQNTSENTSPLWGLRNNIIPSFGARLVQEGHRMHYLADRATLNGEFTPEQLQILDAVFPALVKQLEVALSTGELSPRETRLFTTTLDGMTCDADTLGSCGYVYISVYPTPPATA